MKRTQDAVGVSSSHTDVATIFAGVALYVILKTGAKLGSMLEEIRTH